MLTLSPVEWFAVVTGAIGTILGVRSEWRAIAERRKTTRRDREKALHAISLVVQAAFQLPLIRPSDLSPATVKQAEPHLAVVALRAKEAVDVTSEAYPGQVVRLRDIGLVADQLAREYPGLPFSQRTLPLVDGYAALYGDLYELAAHIRGARGNWGENERWVDSMCFSFRDRNLQFGSVSRDNHIKFPPPTLQQMEASARGSGGSPKSPGA